MVAKKETKALVEKAAEPDLQDQIFTVRSEKVILDSDLADIYGVETKILKKAVARNLKRFPPDFAFRLTQQELTNLRFQNGTSSSAWGGRRYPPWVFTGGRGLHFSHSRGVGVIH